MFEEFVMQTCSHISSCSYLLHQLLGTVQIFDQFHQGRSDQMRKMADAGSDKIVLPVIQHKRESLQGSRKGSELFHCAGGNLFSRSNDVISIFNQMGLRIFITGLFGTCHGMPADKSICQSEGPDLFVDICFGASYIGQKAGVRKEGFQFLEIAGVGRYGGAQIDEIAGGECFIYGLAGLIHCSFPDGCLKGIPASHVGQNPDLRVVHFDCFGQGTAYQSQPDKTNCFYLHVHTPFKLQMKGRLFRRIIRTGISALCSSEFLV